MAAPEEDPKLVTIIDRSDDEEKEEAKNNNESCKMKNSDNIVFRSEDGNNKHQKQQYMYRSKAEEYKMLADLSEFPQLAAMFAFEATINKKSKRRKQNNRRKKRQQLELQPQLTIDEAGRSAVAVFDAKSLVMSSDGMPRELLEAEKMVADECAKLEKHAILSDTNDCKHMKTDVDCDKSATRLSEAPKGECNKKVEDDVYIQQLLESQSLNPSIDEVGTSAVAELDAESVILSADGMPQQLLKMVINEYRKVENLVILSDANDSKPLKNDRNCEKSAAQSEGPKGKISKEVKEDENKGRNSKDVRPGGDVKRDNYVYRTKAEEYKMLADLSNYPQLAAMFAFEARIKKRRKSSENKKRKKNEKLEPEALILTRPKNMAANEGPHLNKQVISLDTSDDEPMKNDDSCDKGATQSNEARKRKRAGGLVESINGNSVTPGEGIYIYRTKAEEYRMLADLSYFPQPAAMFAFEARMKDNMKRNKQKRKKKNHTMESDAQNATVCETGNNGEVLAAKQNIVSANGMPQQVDGPDENNHGNTCKLVGTTEVVNVDNGIRSAIVVNHGLSFFEGSKKHKGTVGLENLKKVVEIEQTEALLRDEPKIFEARDDTNIAVEVKKHVGSTKDAETRTSLKKISVERKENFVLRNLLRSPRYFDFPRSNWELCYICGEDDHKAEKCVKERRKKPCFLCGGLKHTAKHCMKGRVCFKCNIRGHLAKDCPEKDPSNNENYDICLRCGDSGHDMFSCYNDYSPDDLKEIQCSVCKEFGHLCCVNFMHEGLKIMSCYNCGQSDHLGSDCTKSQSDTKGSRANRFRNKCEVKGHLARECREHAKADQCSSEPKNLDRSIKEKEIIPKFIYAPREFFNRNKINQQKERVDSVFFWSSGMGEEPRDTSVERY